MKAWDKLPVELQLEEVKPYYEILRKKQISLAIKRLFDILVSLIMIVILSPILLILSVWIKLDSPGPVFFRQVRVTQYGKEFRIFKFRTMVNDAEKLGTAVTVGGDMRITKVGAKLRKVRLDELPQLFNVFLGDMSFVGTRPEVVKYVNQYSPEMMATLLLPAGITSEASIMYKDEDQLLEGAEDVDKTYVEEVLPGKMKWNLLAIEKFGCFYELGVMFRTVFAVLK